MDSKRAMEVWQDAMFVNRRQIARTGGTDNDIHLADQAAATVIQSAFAEELAGIARLTADAERYRWLRDTSCPPHNFYVSVPDEFAGVRYSAHEVDAYIDKARAALGVQPNAG